MRIVCTVTNDLSHDQRMHRICTTLQRAGHEVTLVGRLLPGSPPLPDRPYRTHRIRCRYRTGKLFYAEYNYRLWRTLGAWTFDVICAVDLDTLLAGYCLKVTGRKLVYDAHEWFSETPEVHPRPLIRKLWRLLGRWLVPRTDARYTVGETIAEQLAGDYGVPFSVIKNTPLHKSSHKKENTGGVILYQGMLNPGRGLETAIYSLNHLANGSLTIVGDGPLRQSMETLVEVNQLNHRVHFVGFQPPEKLSAYTNSAWIGVNLLEGASPSYYYSLANKSLDYLQAGLPSIQMDFPEYRRINDRYGCFELLPRLDPILLANLIRNLQECPDRYEQLRQNCLTAARDLCWENEAPKLLSIYAGLHP